MLQHDSPAMEALSMVADYVVLNLLCLLCCLPVVTVGASMTAKYYVAMKIARGEEPAVVRSFFRAFRENFRQAELIWVVLLGAMAFLAWDWYLIRQGRLGELPFLYLLLLGLATYLVLGTFFSVFALISRFQMRTGEALKGGMIFSLIHLPRVLLGLFLMVLPYVIGIWYVEWALGIWLLCTGTALYYNSRMFVKHFRKMEEGLFPSQEESLSGQSVQES